MPCIHFNGAILTGFHPEYTIIIEGKNYRFEVQFYCGPFPLNKDGTTKNLSNKHPFWKAVSLWAQQGRRVDENSICIWNHEEDPFENAIHLGGKHYLLSQEQPTQP
jgi:hypothetical protein